MTSPEVESNQENTEGRLITAYTWNVGVGGVHAALDALSEWAELHNPAVVMLQECRISKRAVPKTRAAILKAMPEYRAYFHCHNWESTNDRPPAVISLVRHEIDKWCKPLNVCPQSGQSSTLSGRIYPLLFTIPGCLRPTVLVNAWFPHSNYTPNFRSAFLAECTTLHTEWVKANNVIWLGDFNAALRPGQRLSYSKEAKAERTAARPWDDAVQAWVVRNKLHARDSSTMTWHRHESWSTQGSAFND